MAEHWNYITINGVKLIYEYKKAWGKKYYSFDGGGTWNASKRQAYEIAKVSGRLHLAKEQNPRLKRGAWIKAKAVRITNKGEVQVRR